MPRTLLEEQADLLRALGHPARLRIIQLLAEPQEGQAGTGERCVCEIIPVLGMEQSSVSKHLAVLRERGVVEVRREGTRMFYRLTDRRILEILQLAQETCVSQLQQTQKILTHGLLDDQDLVHRRAGQTQSCRYQEK